MPPWPKPPARKAPPARTGVRGPPAAASCAVQQEQAPPETLTRRELKVLRQLDTGQSNSEIADALFISEGTLKWHLHNIYGKLGARSRAGALARARAMGLLG